MASGVGGGGPASGSTGLRGRVYLAAVAGAGFGGATSTEQADPNDLGFPRTAGVVRVRLGHWDELGAPRERDARRADLHYDNSLDLKS